MSGVKGRIWKHRGKYQVIIVIGRKPNGQEQRNYYTCHTHEDAEKLLHQKMAELYAGTYTEPVKLTLQAFAEQWLADYAELQLKKTTVRNYRVSLRHAYGRIGAVKLVDVRPTHIQAVLADAQRRGLAPKTVKHIYTALHRVLGQAVDWGFLQRNPASAIKSPRVPQRDIQIWTPEEVQTFLDAARGHWLYPLYHVALATGMRRGELLGLQWADIDLDRGLIRVRQAASFEHGKAELGDVKTVAGVRVISVGERTVNVLREHRRTGHHGVLGPQVFPSQRGTILPATTARRVMVRLIAKAGVPHIPLHGLRHTHATMLLAAGIHPKVVAERLGHADVGITLNTYSHLLPNLQKEAAVAVDAFLR